MNKLGSYRHCFAFFQFLCPGITLKHGNSILAGEDRLPSFTPILVHEPKTTERYAVKQRTPWRHPRQWRGSQDDTFCTSNERLRPGGNRSPPAPGSACSDQADLLPRPGIPRHCPRLTYVLVGTTTVRVINWVHCDATDDRPRLPLRRVLVPHVPCFKKRFLEAAAARHDAQTCAACVGDNHLAARGQLNASVAVLGMRDHAAAVT